MVYPRNRSRAGKRRSGVTDTLGRVPVHDNSQVKLAPVCGSHDRLRVRQEHVVLRHTVYAQRSHVFAELSQLARQRQHRPQAVPVRTHVACKDNRANAGYPRPRFLKIALLAHPA